MNHLDKAMEHAAASAEWAEKIGRTAYSPDNTYASAQADRHRQQAIMHGVIAIAQALTIPQEMPKRRVHVPMNDAASVDAWALKNGCGKTREEMPVPVDAIRRYWLNSDADIDEYAFSSDYDADIEIINAWLKSLEPSA